MNCITSFWDEEDWKNSHSCLQCRQAFTPRPALVKNTLLAVLAEELKKTGVQAAPADHCYAGAGDVACDVCTGRKQKALKSCLVCLISYCERHLQLHYESPAFEKHKLIDPSKKLQENICSPHNEVMKVFCRTDQRCICYLCSMDEHKGHDTVSAAAERTEKQKKLSKNRQQLQQRIQEREKDVKVLQQQVESICRSADKSVGDTQKMFTELISFLEKICLDVKQQVRTQQESEVSRSKELQEKLKQQISELKKKDAELEQLSLTEDPNEFFHIYPSVSQLSESTDVDQTVIQPLSCFQDVTSAVSDLRDQLLNTFSEKWKEITMTVSGRDVLLGPEPKTRNECLQYSQEITLDPNTANTQLLLSQGNKKATVVRQPREKWKKITMTVSRRDVLLGPEPKTRNECLQYSQEITLDPNTANTQLLLSQGNKKATVVRKHWFYYPHRDRFTERCQVLSTDCLTGRCYWEVEWSGEGVFVAVACKNISRAGDSSECVFGLNDKYWALYCFPKSYQFIYNKIRTPVPGPWSSRIGVFLDHRAGVLSFYIVSKTMTLLHGVQTTFTRPLYAGFWFDSPADTAELCQLR
ncbi:hypothetical protein Q5P01_000151 [Channa striata]|uniref:Tripartite motif-containing protein 16-like n=1 Tax=Channa striata TaxID=64152 RepID=A0AA88IIL5_CHASR|nr:hypothetical protein Q5P01_000151 [Channa striata]